ncbi:hypothetical protein FSARC_2652 [Fusarium sarcochroum]|uniref:Uncharacterized protein n=1 Tax=Fusarium sarcochroum TaxID=1208366 RepID=A0A8H4U645_9HYPO|nr:hypothetical protein FSARC_2652 [Fusarium sarcochroum]
MAKRGFAFAGPCKPRTTSGGVTATTTLDESSTTTTLSEESTTTLAEETSTVTLSDASTTTLADLSTTITLSEASTTTVAETTTTLLSEESTTTTAGETTTTTFVEESTTTTLAQTTTTTTIGFEGTPLAAIFDDGDELYGYVRSDGGYLSSNEEGSTPAIFAIEPDTSRLFATLSDGSKLYSMTVIPDGPIYSLVFDTAENIETYDFYHFITCIEDADHFLSCQSEGGPTDITWYYTAGNQIYYGTDISGFHQYQILRFRIQ